MKNDLRRMLFFLNRGHRLKERKIIACRTLLGTTTLVETGTYLGEMVNATKHAFSDIHSIELDPTLAQEAKDYFKKHPHIHIYAGDSGIVLKDIVRALDGPAIFWLDAHYSAGITAKSEAFGDTPIQEELRILLASWRARSAVLIDDARLFIGSGGYPTIAAIQELVARSGLPLSCFVDNDIIHIL